jgi:hypothetical protein
MKGLKWFLYYEYILCTLCSKRTTISDNEKPEAVLIAFAENRLTNKSI